MIFHYTSGGALVCETEIKGVTQDASTSEWWEPSWYDGFRYFVAESMSKEAARRIAHGLGGVLMETNVPVSRQLVSGSVDKRELSYEAMYGMHVRGKQCQS